MSAAKNGEWGALRPPPPRAVSVSDPVLVELVAAAEEAQRILESYAAATGPGYSNAANRILGALAAAREAGIGETK